MDISALKISQEAETRYLLERVSYAVYMSQAQETLRRCRHCSTRQNNKRSKVQCSTCGVPLCIIPALQNFIRRKNELRLFCPLCQCQLSWNFLCVCIMWQLYCHCLAREAWSVSVAALDGTIAWLVHLFNVLFNQWNRLELGYDPVCVANDTETKPEANFAASHTTVGNTVTSPVLFCSGS